jgi:hypothetical protein
MRSAKSSRLGPADSFGGNGAEELVEFRVHVEAGVRCVMRRDEEDARSLRGLKATTTLRAARRCFTQSRLSGTGPVSR